MKRVWTAPLRWPGRVAAAAAALFALSLLSVATTRLDADVENVIDTAAADAYEHVARAFGWRERIYLLIEAQRPGHAGDLLALGSAIARRLEDEPTIAGVTFGAPLPDAGAVRRLLFPHGLLLLDAARLERLLTAAGIRGRIERQAELLALPGLGDQVELAERDPLGLQVLLAEPLRALRGGYEFAEGSRWFLSSDGEALLVVVRGRSLPGDVAPWDLVEVVEGAVAAARAEVGAEGLAVRGTGGPYLAAETERTLRRDLVLSLSASLVLAAGLLAVALRIGVLHVLWLCVPTVWGATTGLGLFTALRGEVSALSFGCAAILVGLGIDFTIHVTIQALAERERGRGAAGAVLRSLRQTRGRLVLAALTSIAAFSAFLLSDSRFLREMGMLTAIGLGTGLLSPFVVLPPILARVLRDRGRRGVRPVFTAPMERLAALAAAPRRVLAAAAVVTVAALAAVVLEPPRIEHDLENLGARGSPALATQARIAARFGAAADPFLVLVRTPRPSAREVVADARRVEAVLEPLVGRGVLADVTSIADVVPPPAAQRRRLAVLAGRDPDALAAELRDALDDAGFVVEAFEDYVEGFRSAVANRDPLDVEVLERAGLGALVDGYVHVGRSSADALVVARPRGEPSAGAGRVLGEVRRALAATPVRVVVTGQQAVAAEVSEHVAADFRQVSLLTVAAVCGVLLLRLRSPGRLLLVATPALLGSIWTAGVLATTGQRLNMMNLGVLPMVLALGIDDGIHMVMHSSGRRSAPLREVMRATGTGVLLTSATTMVTFGSLAWSENRGLASVGRLTFVGLGACLVATLAVVPALLVLCRPVAEGGPARAARNRGDA